MLKYITKLEDDKLYFDKSVILNEKRYKKITGTNLYKLTNNSKYESSEVTMLSRLGIYTPKFPEFYSDRGKCVEHFGIKYLENIVGKSVTTWEPRDVNYDNYKDVQVFGGLKDGQFFYTDEFGQERNVIVEVKSTDTSKSTTWHQGIPEDYYYQAGLYAELDNATDVYFVVVYCSDYVNEKIKNKDFSITMNDLTFDLFKLEFDANYKKDVLKAKIDASKNASEIFNRGYIDLKNLNRQTLEEIKEDLDKLRGM